MSLLNKNVFWLSLLALAFAGLLLLGGCRKRGAAGSGVTVVPIATETASAEEDSKEEENALENLIAHAAEGNLKPLRAWIATEPGGDEPHQALLGRLSYTPRVA